MAEENEFYAIQIEKFQSSAQKLSTLVYKDSEEFRRDLNLLLDELNSVEYYLKIVKEEDASLCLKKCVYLVPIHQELLVTKVCQLIVNLVSRQQLVLESNLDVIVEYVVECLKACQAWTYPDLLRALGALVYENCARLEPLYEELIGSAGLLFRLAESSDDETRRGAIQSIENLCSRTSLSCYLDEAQQMRCNELFMRVLHTPRPACLDEVSHCRVVVSALRGLQNIILASRSFPLEHLGGLLAAIKVYMVHGLGGPPSGVPSSLHPVPLSHYDSSQGVRPVRKEESDDTTSLRPKLPGKAAMKKSHGKKSTRSRRKDVPEEDALNSGVEKINLALGGSHPEAALLPPWIRLSSSESEYSDTEGSQANKLRAYHSKVRQCTLGCFHAVIKVTEKRVMFGYWTSFLPDTTGLGGPPQGQNLFTTILKDPSPKARAGALAVLTALVEGSKAFLMAAEDSDSNQGPFTPFSVKLAIMVKEIHRCLLLALMSENSTPALTQIIKCLATLIPNVQYQRLKPGLLTRVTKQIKPFLMYRDPNIRVACLTCLGSVVTVQAPLMEVWQMLSARHRNTSITSQVDGGTRNAGDSGYGSRADTVGSAEKMVAGSGTTTPGTISGCATPALDALNCEASWVVRMCTRNVAPGLLESVDVAGERGKRMPLAGEQMPCKAASPTEQAPCKEAPPTEQTPCKEAPLAEQTPCKEAPLVGDQTPFNGTQPLKGQKHCKGTVGEQTPCKVVPPVRALGEQTPGKTAAHVRAAGETLQPLPVRLESLQLMAQLTKGYFAIISPCLPLVYDLVSFCMDDDDPSVQLHGAKLLEAVGSQLLQKLREPMPSDLVTTAQVVELWVKLLSGPIPRVLQNMTNHAVKSTTCDCLANIGPQIFQDLPPDKTVLCITLLLGMTGDEDHRVRASAVRALGVYVLYPCLREDISFVADVANTIITALEETNLSVKVKAAWSLGNLSDALVLNKGNGDQAFMDDFSDMLLLKLFEIAIKGAQDNDKVKSNALRALGNFLRYMPSRSYNNSRFSHAVDNGIQALVKNVGTGTMKSRWNACYATSNMFKNTLLPLGTAPWTESILKALAAVVRDCKNFKVRFNAAMAFSVPNSRHCYAGVYVEIWDSLITGLQNSETVADFSEYKYMDNLLEQVCGTLLHLASKIMLEDLPGVHAILSERVHIMEDYMKKYRQIRAAKTTAHEPLYLETLPDTAEAQVDMEAMGLLSHLQEIEEKLDDPQLKVIECLKKIFLPPGESLMHKEIAASEQFRQTYD